MQHGQPYTTRRAAAGGAVAVVVLLLGVLVTSLGSDGEPKVIDRKSVV